MEKQNPASLLETLVESAEAYSITTYTLLKLKLVQVTTVVVTYLLSYVIVLILLCLFALILNIGIALFLGELMGKGYYGFFIVAAFNLVAGIMAHIFLRKWIKRPISQVIAKQAFQ